MSRATYQALGQLPALSQLTIKICDLRNAQGDGFHFLTAKHVHLEILNVMDRDYEDLLPWANVCHIMRVHKLTLWDMTDRAMSLLRPMPFLQTLSIVDSPDFTGSTLSCHSNVTSLSLISCDLIGTGLKHMLAVALPQVTKLEIQASHEPFTAVPMSHQVLEALQYGRSLETIDLRGVTGLTASDFRQLQLLFSRSSPPVAIKLPCVELGQHQPVTYVRGGVYLPTLVQLPGHTRHHTLEPRQPVFRTFRAVLFCAMSVCAALW